MHFSRIKLLLLLYYYYYNTVNKRVLYWRFKPYSPSFRERRAIRLETSVKLSILFFTVFYISFDLWISLNTCTMYVHPLVKISLQKGITLFGISLQAANLGWQLLSKSAPLTFISSILVTSFIMFTRTYSNRTIYTSNSIPLGIIMVKIQVSP